MVSGPLPVGESASFGLDDLRGKAVGVVTLEGPMLAVESCRLATGSAADDTGELLGAYLLLPWNRLPIGSLAPLTEIIDSCVNVGA